MTIDDPQQMLAALPADGSLPLSATRAALDALQRRRYDLQRRVTLAQSAAQTLAALSTAADDTWRALTPGCGPPGPRG